MTELLLDTHAMLWFFWDDPQLSSVAKSAIEDSQNRKLVSVATCWEIEIKAGLGKLDLGEPSQLFLQREIVANNFKLLPISLVLSPTRLRDRCRPSILCLLAPAVRLTAR